MKIADGGSSDEAFWFDLPQGWPVSRLRRFSFRRSFLQGHPSITGYFMSRSNKTFITSPLAFLLRAYFHANLIGFRILFACAIVLMMGRPVSPSSVHLLFKIIQMYNG